MTSAFEAELKKLVEEIVRKVVHEVAGSIPPSSPVVEDDMAQFKRPGANRSLGYMTILDWYALFNPEALRLMGDPLHDTVSDGRLASKYCKEHNRTTFKVTACQYLRECGIPHVQAYPVEVLNTLLKE